MVVLPRGIGWMIGGIAAVVLGLAIAWALFVPAADWLAHHDVGSVKGSLYETAVDNARGRLLTLGAGLFAAGALVFTARNFALSRAGQVTDRYTRAVEQLGSDKLDVRIGGIYALERVARDSARDHRTVIEVLTAFIREHSHEQWPRSGGPAGRGQERPGQEQSIRPDIMAALTVIRRRYPYREIVSIDLSGATLPGAVLRRADLRYADLTGADLTGADLADADLSYANLKGTELTGADLSFAVLFAANLTGAVLRDTDLGRAGLRGAHLDRAVLTGVNLYRADLTGAELIGANLSGADVKGATLRGARLWGGNLTGARLGGADFRNANLRDADLTDAVFGNADDDAAFAALREPIRGGPTLTGAYLDDARWPESAPVPEGWRRNTDSGRLEKRDTGSGPPTKN